MKPLIKIIALSIALNTLAVVSPQKTTAQQVDVNFQLFYDQLSPYGQWVDYPNYGYVWMPTVDPTFSPYATGGHWVLTMYGWTWVSDYPWGWAPFHYGRWDYDDVYGWFWVPDNVWAPAWVAWRSAPGYYGWAPIRPGISVNLVFGNQYNPPNDRWVFVSDRDIDRPDINHYYVNREKNVTIINNSTVIVNKSEDNSRHVTYIAGPGRDDVQKVTQREIKPVAIEDNDRPGQKVDNGQLSIYRPQVEKNNSAGQKPAPKKVETLKDVKPVAERKNIQQNEDMNHPDNNKNKPLPQPSIKQPPVSVPNKNVPSHSGEPKTQQVEPRPVTPKQPVSSPNKTIPPEEKWKIPPQQQKEVAPEHNVPKEVPPSPPIKGVPPGDNQKIEPPKEPSRVTPYESKQKPQELPPNHNSNVHPVQYPKAEPNKNAPQHPNDSIPPHKNNSNSTQG